MSNQRETLNVSLSPEHKAFVASKVKSGRYLTASEVIREGLRLLEEQDHLKEMRLRELQAEIRKGLEALDRGEKVDGKTTLRRLKKRIGDAHAEKKKK